MTEIESVYDLWRTYYGNTRMTRAPGRGFDWNYDSNEDALSFAVSSRRSLPARRRIFLTPSEDLDGVSLVQVLRSRRSVRRFSKAAVSFEKLSSLLYFSAGQTGSARLFGGREAVLTANPSAGGLASTSVWVVPVRVDGLSNMALHVPEENCIALSRDTEFVRDAMSCLQQLESSNAAIAIILTADFGKVIRKYGVRGSRYALLDAGHLAQNILLVAGAVGLTGFSSCGFFDIEVDKLVGIDGLSEVSVYVIYLGVKEECDGDNCTPY